MASKEALRQKYEVKKMRKQISLHLFDSMFLIEVFAPVFSGAWLINTLL